MKKLKGSFGKFNILNKKSRYVVLPVIALVALIAVALPQAYAATDFLEDNDYNFLFKATFDGNATDTGIHSLASSGSADEYVATDNGQAARFSQQNNTGFSYTPTQDFLDSMYDSDGFSIVARYRVDQLVAAGSGNSYAGGVASIFNTTGDNRSWVLTHRSGSASSDSNKTQFISSSAGATGANSNSDVATGVNNKLGEWATVVITYNGSGQIKTYYNGDTAVTTTNASIFKPSVATPFEVGRFGSQNSSMNGLIDYMYVLDKGMPQNDVTGFYNSLVEEEGDNHTLNYSAASNGTVQGDTNQTIQNNGSGTSVTAVPNEGYQFIGWSDGVSSNPRLDTDVTTDISAKAQFAIMTAADSNANFFADKNYSYLFKTDFSNNLEDSARSVSPSSGGDSIDGYAALNNGYAVNVSKDLNSRIAYPTAGSLYDGLYDNDGFTLVTRYRLDSLNPGSYTGMTAGIYDTANNKRSWGLSHQQSGDVTTFSTSTNGGSGAQLTHTSAVSNISAKKDDWVTVVATYNGSGQIRVYVDGNLAGSANDTSIYAPGTDSPLEIAGFPAGSMSGSIDYVYLLDKNMSSNDINEFFTGEESEDPEDPGNLVELTNRTFTNSDGLSLEYDMYYRDNTAGPIAVTSDSWNSNRINYRQHAKYMAENHGFIGLNLDTRGKGNSEGAQDAIGYECRDIYELVEHIKKEYPQRHDSSQGSHIFGYSAGGGKTLMCPGRYPDYFTSAYATGSVASMTNWYLLPHATSLDADRQSMRERTGNSVNPGVVRYHPTGGASGEGSIENQEAYTARSADIIGAPNSLAHTYVTHNTGDPRVPVQLSQNYRDSWNSSDKDPNQDFSYFECNANVHSICDINGGYAWLNSHKGVVTLPGSGSFKIGGWVETKKFKVEFLEDVGYTGEVDYGFNGQYFKFDISADSYTGPTEVVAKSITDDMDIYDDDTLIGKIRDGDLIDDDGDYNMTYSSNKLTIVIPDTNSTQTIESIAPEAESSEPGVASNLSATRANAQVSLSWTAPVDDGGSPITDYVVQYKPSASGTWSTFNDGTSTNTNATVTGLTNGTEYDFRVRAVNAVGEGANSNTASAKPATTPGIPSVSAGNEGAAIKLTWAAPSTGGEAITDYVVQFKKASDSTWETFNDGTNTSTSVIVDRLDPGIIYNFRVAAKNVVGTGSFSTTQAIMTATNVTELDNAETNKSILLTTPDATDITCRSAVKESSLNKQDTEFNYPLGLVNFCFDTNEDDNQVSLVFVTNLKPSEVTARKYNPDTKVFTDIPNASTTETTINGQHALRLTYTIADNGPLDLDPADGKIVDPAGLGIQAGNNNGDGGDKSNGVVKGESTDGTGAPNTGLEKVNSWIYVLASSGGAVLAFVAYLLYKRTHAAAKK